MTNPDNIVRVRARNGGRASVYEANGWCQPFSSGVLEGNGVVQNTSADMNVLVGGSASKPDVLIAENASGYKVALDIVGQQAVAITAPASNNRISAIVAYTDDLSLATTEDTVTGSPASCGLIVVNGTAAASPSEPTENQIRTAITADGATGSQAAYCVIATILVANDTTIITDNLITPKIAQMGAHNLDFTTLKKLQTVCVATLYHSFTAEVDGTLMLLGVGSSTWGYGGGTMTFGFTKDSGDAIVQAAPSVLVRGGDTVGRTVVVSAKVKFQAGQTARLTVTKTDGPNAQNFTTGFCFGIFIPDEYNKTN